MQELMANARAPTYSGCSLFVIVPKISSNRTENDFETHVTCMNNLGNLNLYFMLKKTNFLTVRGNISVGSKKNKQNCIQGDTKFKNT